MAKPTPSPTEAAAINAQIADLNNQTTSLTDSANAQNAIIARNQSIDTAFKNLFNWYNDSVIGKYDAERKAINGTFVTSPVVEADILAVAQNPPAGRLVPTPPATAIVRIAEFDAGGYTGSTTLNELQHLLDEEPWITYLMSGVSGTLPTVTVTTLTASALTPSSTTLDVTDAVGPASFAIGNIILVHDGGTNAAVAQVTAVTPGIGVPPPYTFTLGITLKIPPVGTIVTGSKVLAGFTGFTNPERIAKVATDPNKQPLMDYCILQLQNTLNARLPRIADQLTALNANEDPDGMANITTAKNNATTAQSFINGYLPTTDISNTGLGSVITERTVRTSYLNTRVTQILNAYTMQTENYYNQRYNTANNRGDTSRGTLRTLQNASNVQTVLNGMVSGIAATTSALNSIL